VANKLKLGEKQATKLVETGAYVLFNDRT